MQLLGLHLEKKTLTLALIHREKKLFQIKNLQKISLEDPQKIERLLTSFVGEKTWTISILETKHVLLRSLEMIFKTKGAFLKALPFQLDQLIPYPLEEGIILPLFEKRLLFQKPTSSTVTLLCLHEKTYKEHLSYYQKHHIDPDWIGYVPQGVYRFVCYYTEETTCTILHMSEDSTHLVVMIKERLSYALQIDLGKDHFIQALQLDSGSFIKEELDQLFEGFTFGNLSEERFPHFFTCIRKFSCELDRFFYFLIQKNPSEKLDRFVFLKEADFLKQFIGVLEKSLGTSIYSVDSDEMLSLAEYAIPIGVAIDGFSKDGKKVQFKKPCEITLNLKRCFIKKIGKYALACVICSVFSFFSSQLILKAKENSLDKQLSYLIKNYASELPAFQKNEQDHSILTRLKQAEKYLNKTKKPYGYYLTPTSVSSFLEKIIQDDRFKEGLRLEELEYTLENYPSIEHPEIPYKICVRCSVTSLKQNVVEVFFQELAQKSALLEEGTQIDLTKKDLRYEASFYLKAN
ncbi:MAG: hypothetical protein WCG10_02375 [Chlamydiota bacterium]